MPFGLNASCFFLHGQHSGGLEERALCQCPEHPRAAAAHLQSPWARRAPAPRLFLCGGAPGISVCISNPEGTGERFLEGKWRIQKAESLLDVFSRHIIDKTILGNGSQPALLLQLQLQLCDTWHCLAALMACHPLPECSASGSLPEGGGLAGCRDAEGRLSWCCVDCGL